MPRAQADVAFVATLPTPDRARPAAPARRARLGIAAAALLAGLGVAAAFVFPETQSVLQGASAPPPDAGPRAEPVPRAEPEPEPEPEPAIAARHVAFTSDPLGVQILIGELRCSAPCALELAPGPHTIVGRYPGRPDVRTELEWPPPAAVHVAVPPPPRRPPAPLEKLRSR